MITISILEEIVNQKGIDKLHEAMIDYGGFYESINVGKTGVFNYFAQNDTSHTIVNACREHQDAAAGKARRRFW